MHRIILTAVLLPAIVHATSSGRADTPSPKRIATLVAKLNSASWAARERACERLLQVGAAARSQLQAASASGNPEIRRRAQRLLILIDRHDFSARLRAFAAGDSKIALPGWKPFRLLMGDDHGSRKLFVEMQRQERGLLAAYENDAELAEELCAMRCAKVTGSGDELPFGSAATLLFISRARDKNEHRWPYHHGYLLHYIGWQGNRSCIKLLEPSLDDESVVGGSGVQVRDIALAAVVRLSGQYGPDYGLKHPFPQTSWNQTPWDHLAIGDARARDKGIAKWRAWRKRHPQLVPPSEAERPEPSQ